MNKRDFLKSVAVLGAGSLVKPSLANGFFADSKKAVFELPKLDYSVAALEPHIDALTMEIHHDKHHAAYVANLNKAIENTRFAKESVIEEILITVNSDETAIRNNTGGHYNHSLFWKLLSPVPQKRSAGLAKAIDEAFGSFEKFQEQFEAAAKNRFGSGWAWLCMNTNTKKLFITSTPNQDNPLMTKVVKEIGTPILALDVWEHAYYLHYQNRRPEYISAFWNVVNWAYVNELYVQSLE